MNTPQFDLGAMLSAPQTAIQQIPCDQLKPYHNHKFELYSGERLEDMVASIKENGVLSPIIVQPIEDGYEILIGHNRWNASKLAGLPTVPAIVKTDLRTCTRYRLITCWGVLPREDLSLSVLTRSQPTSSSSLTSLLRLKKKSS